MPAFICAECGTQFSPSDSPPDGCAICQEERQYVNPRGQGWMTLEQMHGSGKPWLATHRNTFAKYEHELFGIGAEPGIGIGQRALLLRTPHGNVLWDCIAFLDDATIEIVGALGGIAAIAISHPHYYTCMVEWSHAFEAPILLHSGDQEWVMRPDPTIEFWEGETKEIFPGVTLIRVAGHFTGSTVLHWAADASGKGALLSGDSVQVVGPDKTVTFMWSYPNLIPLDASTVQRVADVLEPWPFEQIYGAWWEALIKSGGKQILANSARRYIDAVSRPPPGQRGE